MSIDKKYESALAASEGWIEWGGGECPPVTHGTMVDVKLRDGSVFFNKQCWGRGYSKIPGFKVDATSEAGGAFWRAESSQRDIIAYRLHKPDINSRANDDRLERDLNECIGQPVQWHGDGVPPVGIECEVKWTGGKWEKCEVLFVGTEKVVVEMRNREAAMSLCDVKFRPLRTEAEKSREADINAMLGVVTNYNKTDVIHAIEQLYDAGYRKEVK